jgi:hypothetical protein
VTDKSRKALEELIAAYIEDRHSSGHDGNAPGHAHDVAGIWDADNVPEKRGTKCRWCAAWFAARAVLATAPAELQMVPCPACNRAMPVNNGRLDLHGYMTGPEDAPFVQCSGSGFPLAATPSAPAMDAGDLNGPSQEGADGTAAAPPTAPAEPPKDGEVAALIELLNKDALFLESTRMAGFTLIAENVRQAVARLSAPVPELTERERGVLRHALTGGRDTPPYRNHFAASEGHADMPTLRALVARGLMTERKSSVTPDTLFHCTEAGAKAVGLHLPYEPTAAPVPAREWIKPHSLDWFDPEDKRRPPECAAAEPEKPVAWYMPIGGRHSIIEWGAKRPDRVGVVAWHPLYASPSAQPIAREPPPDDSQLAGDVAYLRAKNDPRLFDIANQLIYCWAQDGLLSKAQAERDKFRDELAETKRPLDALLLYEASR